MKKTLLSIILVLLPSFLMAQALSGDYYIPKGSKTQGYSTLAEAITAVNTNGVSGTVTFFIDSSLTETGANCVLTRSDMSSTNNLVIKPATGKTPTITFTGCSSTSGASQYTGITLNSASYVTIDGSNTAGGTTKDLTLQMAGATTGRIIIGLYANCDEIIIKNCNINFAGTMSTAATTTCIYANGQAAGVVDDLLVENNTIGDATNIPYYAVRITGASSTPLYASDIKVKNNILTAAMRTVYYYYVGSSSVASEISGNQISAASSTVTGYVVYGTILNTYKGTIDIFNNKYITIKSGNAAAQGLYGISSMGSQAGAALNIHNNFFSDFQCVNAAGNTTPVYGIYLQDAPAANIYFNSINMSPVNNTTAAVAGINSGSSATANILNNIIVNDYSAAVDNSFGIRLSTSTVATSNYNDIYVKPTSSIGYAKSKSWSTLKAWQDSTGQDLNSISVNPAFTSVMDLHIPKDSMAIIGKGIKIDGYTKDIDGETRDTIPELGADELEGIVPVELSSFAAAKTADCIELAWSTATETNNAYFDVERKYEGKSWVKIASVRGNGTTAEGAKYSYRDEDALSGTIYYRLKQVDFDGTYKYTASLSVNLSVPEQFELSQNYPNPFNPATVIKYSIPQNSNVKLEVYSITGQLVKELVNKAESAGEHSVVFNAAGLASGTYIYRIQAGSFVQIKKMMLIK